MFKRTICKLATKTWGKKLLVPVIILACGWSQFTYLLFGIPKSKQALYDKYMGLLEPELDPHWQALANASDSGQVFHELKNVGVEYTRANAQPAAKFFSMILILLVLQWCVSTSLALYFYFSQV